MNITIHLFKPPIEGDEYHAMTAFLRWQNKNAVQVVDGAILAETKGKPVPVVKVNGETVAMGYRALIGYWDAEGLFLI